MRSDTTMRENFRILVARERQLEREYAEARKIPKTIDGYNQWFMDSESREELSDRLCSIREEIKNVMRDFSPPLIDKCRKKRHHYWVV